MTEPRPAGGPGVAEPPICTTSVVICAYTLDRWDQLVRATRSAALQEPAPNEVILVADHNDDLLRRARDHFALPVNDVTIRVLPNRHGRGLSGARNTGTEQAIGAVIAFLDDDAVADRGWLRRLADALSEPDVMIAGGWAEPYHLDQVPTWWPHELNWIVGCSHVGLPPNGGPVRNVLGCTMAFRREVFDIAGGFDEGVGRVGNAALGCEETELCIRLTQRRGGQPVRLVPAAQVRHDVSLDRFTWGYLVRRSRAEGVSKARVRGMTGNVALSTETAYVTKVLPRALRRSLTGTVRRRPGSLRQGVAVLTSLSAASLGFAQTVALDSWRRRRFSTGAQATVPNQ